uniref:Protein kinase domain-containing protein n=1 Tax=Meloidogyne hapla TaxID=6305 RepID=A0A1I8AZK3_MELHA
MFIVMELERVSLQSYFYKNVEENSNYKANLNERENFLKKIIRGAATALEQFHKYAIHLDIKPDNFLISRTQNNEDYLINCKLIDFNTSVITPYKRKTIQTYGSPFFMAPEIRTTYIHQVNKIIRNNINKKRKVTRKVDIWAFGLMIYDLLYLKTDYFHQLIEENANIYNILDAEFVDYRLNAELNTDLDRGCIQLRLNKRPSIIAIKLFLYGECNGFEYERNQLREDTNWCPK